jgi:hypothetical protein
VERAPPSRLVTAESIVIDGANGVTGAPRAGFPHSTLGIGFAVLALAVTVLFVRRRWPTWVLLAVMVGASVPGLTHVVIDRDDAVFKRAGLADRISQSLADLQQTAPWPRVTVNVERDDGDVLSPLARYAWPTRTTDGGLHLELRGTALGTGCKTRGQFVACGSAP